MQNIEIPKNGYLYVYVSNEGNQDVFFDNLQVVHARGPILEETHYYPFGLTMAGISSEAINFGHPENKKKYNGIELDKDLELNQYEAQFRDLDPQTARWWQIDPKTDGYENVSPYASMYDDPMKISDPLGDEGTDCCKGLWSVVGGAAAILDDATGINLRKELAPSANDAEAVENYNHGQDGGDAAAMYIGASESTTGSAMVSGGGVAMATGVAAPEGAVAAGAGGLLTVHGAFTAMRGGNALLTQKDRVQVSSTHSSQDSGGGRGKNNRNPDPHATGDHTVSNDRGSTTFKKNEKNPSGFQEAKRVDTKGKAHNGVPTPHVHENGKVRPAQRNEIPKTDLSKNKQH